MSVNRICPNCFKKDSLRVNFGSNMEAEMKFHSEKWCKCGYNSATEMMEDQDMGFKDPSWIPIAKSFLESYHSTIYEGHIHNPEQLVRFFLKLLKSSANNYWKSIELIEQKRNEESIFSFFEGYETVDVDNGIAKNKPKTNIFKDSLFPTELLVQHQPKQDKSTNDSESILLYCLLSVFIGFVIGFIVFKFI